MSDTGDTTSIKGRRDTIRRIVKIASLAQPLTTWARCVDNVSAAVSAAVSAPVAFNSLILRKCVGVSAQNGGGR